MQRSLSLSPEFKLILMSNFDSLSQEINTTSKSIYIWTPLIHISRMNAQNCIVS